MFGQYNGISFGQWWGDSEGGGPAAQTTPARGPYMVTVGRFMN
jgi:hypothetical protein